MVNRVLTSPYLWWFDVFPLIGYVPRPLLKVRSEEHTSELQSQSNLVCRLLLEKKHNYRPPQRRLMPQIVKSYTLHLTQAELLEQHHHAVPTFQHSDRGLLPHDVLTASKQRTTH